MPNKFFLTRRDKIELQNLLVPNPEPSVIDFSHWNNLTSNENSPISTLCINTGLGFDSLLCASDIYLQQNIIRLLKRSDCIITVPNFKKLNNFYKKNL